MSSEAGGTDIDGVHRTEAFANLTGVARSLLGFVERGDLAALLLGEPRDQRSTRRALKRLSPAEIDQLVAEYQAGIGSVYDLAARYGVHRNTVSAALKARGLLLGRQPLSEDESQQARTLRREGLSFNAIGRAVGRDPKTIKAAIEANGESSGSHVISASTVAIGSPSAMQLDV